MNMATKLQKKCDEVWDENYYEDSKLKKAKAIGAAMLSGAIDGAVIVYPIMLVGLIAANRELKKLRNQ